ncbi:unnamed protein product [Fraxinus pennsylvanica]|uniref:HMA domain-containing protein n=1 Tax=Fraxinus pennsylvanica TaxID=56036 RepID=A0AAD2ADE4_9LAMI|nr:unnamed protein product [Fraxinus pennsylvanica]
MGEKDETETEKENKNEGEKAAVAAADGGGKKDDNPITVVLKLNLHCEGCAKKVKRSVRHFEGVENVKADWGSSRLTVIGKMDPAWLREQVEYKTKKKVELVSTDPKKDAGAKKSDDKSDNKIEEKSDKKPEEEKEDDKKPEEPTPSTVVMKIKLHCDECAHKIKRIINKNIDGVDSVSTNLEKDLVTINGTMDIKHLTAFLKEKLNRSVDIVPPKKDESGEDEKGKDGGEEKKEGGDGGQSGGNSEKKDDDGGEGSKIEGTKDEVNKMEYQAYNSNTHYAVPMYHQSYVHHDYTVSMYNQGHVNTGHMVQYSQGPPPPPPTYVNMNDEMFSDENPNGCFIM